MDAVAETGARPRKLGLAYIEPDLVDRLIAKEPIINKLLDKACSFSGGRFDRASVIEGCAGRNPNWHPQLWVCGLHGGNEAPTLESIAITAISTFPTGLKILEIVMVAGRQMNAWLQFEDDFAAWAKRQGCERMQLIGRRGWERTVPHWTKTGHVLERPVVRESDGAV